MSEIFDKRVRVRVGAAGASGLDIHGGQSGQLRVTFEISKSLDADSNTATVRIFGLTESTRRQIAQGQTLLVDAGYVGRVGLLFRGDVSRVSAERDGADAATVIESEDGRRALKSKVNTSFAPGISPKKIVDQLIDGARQAADSEKGFISGAIEEAKAFQSGFVASGTVESNLQKIAERTGLSFSVQDGAFQILDDGEVVAIEAIVASPDTGLEGVAAVTDEGAKVSMRLNPDARPGRLIRVQSRGVSGDFRAESCTYAGDTHGESWTVQMECKEL